MKMSLLFVASTFLIAACGGRALQHTVNDKELLGITGDTALKLDASRGEVARAEDDLRSFDVKLIDSGKQLDSIERQQDAAQDALDAAESRIDSTRDSESQAVKKAATARDEKIAAIKKVYEEEARDIRARFASEQAGNRDNLADAKGTKALADLEKKHLDAQLAKNEVEKEIRAQMVWVKKAELEQTKFQAFKGLKAVQTETDAKRSVAFEKQVLAEKQTLTKIQERLLAKEKNVEAARSRLDQERVRFGGTPTPPAAPKAPAPSEE